MRNVTLVLLLILGGNAVEAQLTPEDGTPQRGLWWDPSRPGSGVDLHRSNANDRFSFIWYTYDAQGNPIWYLGVGELDDSAIAADLLRFQWSPEETAAHAEVVGQASWVFSNPFSAEFRWQLGDEEGLESIAPFTFGAGVPKRTVSGQWHDATQTGWGLTLANQGQTQVAIAYFYDVEGNPTWELGQGPSSDNNETPITLHQFMGSCPHCVYVEPQSTEGAALTLRHEGKAVKVSLTGEWQREETTLTRLTEPLFFDAGDGILPSQTSAIVGVNVRSMQDQSVLADQTVLISNGLIETLSPTQQAQLPQGTHLVRATGQWLIPGLIDSHVHFAFGPNVENDLFVMLAYGVTGMRQMWGQSGVLDWRQRLRDGEVVGPRLFSASPGVEQPPGFWPQTILVQNEPQARQAVRDQSAAGFDFLKVYNNLSPQLYAALANEARALGMRWVGHVSGSVGVRTALNEGQWTIEHLTGYASEATNGGSTSWNATLNQSRTTQIAQLTAQSNTWNCPTQVVIDRSRDDIARIRASRIWRLISPAYRSWFEDPQTQPGGRLPERFLNNRLAMIKALHDAGAGLVAGTDSGVQYVLPGPSLYEEIEFFVEAGLSEFNAIRAATVNAAKMLGQEGKLGVVAPGAYADLLLLDADPIADLAQLQSRVGVYSRGQYWSTASIEERLTQIEQSYQ